MAIARVQAAKNTAEFASCVITLSSTGAGNLIVVGFASNPDVDFTVTDNQSNTYTKLVEGIDPDDGRISSYIFYCANATGGVTAVTINRTGSNELNGVAMEYSGVATVTPADGSNGGGSGFVNTDDWSTGSVATTDTDLLIGVCGEYYSDAGSTWGAGSGWTIVDKYDGPNPPVGGYIYVVVEERLNVAAGTYVADGTWSGGSTQARYGYCIGAFKAAAAAGGGVPRQLAQYRARRV